MEGLSFPLAGQSGSSSSSRGKAGYKMKRGACLSLFWFGADGYSMGGIDFIRPPRRSSEATEWMGRQTPLDPEYPCSTLEYNLKRRIKAIEERIAKYKRLIAEYSNALGKGDSKSTVQHFERQMLLLQEELNLLNDRSMYEMYYQPSMTTVQIGSTIGALDRRRSHVQAVWSEVWKKMMQKDLLEEEEEKVRKLTYDAENIPLSEISLGINVSDVFGEDFMKSLRKEEGEKELIKFSRSLSSLGSRSSTQNSTYYAPKFLNGKTVQEAVLTREEREQIRVDGRVALYGQFESVANSSSRGDSSTRDLVTGDSQEMYNPPYMASDPDHHSKFLEPERVLLADFHSFFQQRFYVTSSKFQYDLIKHFRGSKRNETILEIGCASGKTTAVFVKLFKTVICVEKRKGFFSNKIPNYPNLIKITADLYQENWAFTLGSTPVHVVFIDALHDYAAVNFDLRNVMSHIPCCIHTMIFHDFYFPSVMKAVHDNGITRYFGKKWKHIGLGARRDVYHQPFAKRNFWESKEGGDISVKSLDNVGDPNDDYMPPSGIFPRAMKYCEEIVDHEGMPLNITTEEAPSLSGLKKWLKKVGGRVSDKCPFYQNNKIGRRKADETFVDGPHYPISRPSPSLIHRMQFNWRTSPMRKLVDVCPATKAREEAADNVKQPYNYYQQPPNLYDAVEKEEDAINGYLSDYGSPYLKELYENLMEKIENYEVQRPWLLSNSNHKLMLPLMKSLSQTFHWTHSEGLLVELKDKFISRDPYNEEETSRKLENRRPTEVIETFDEFNFKSPNPIQVESARTEKRKVKKSRREKTSKRIQKAQNNPSSDMIPEVISPVMDTSLSLDERLANMTKGELSFWLMTTRNLFDIEGLFYSSNPELEARYHQMDRFFANIVQPKAILMKRDVVQYNTRHLKKELQQKDLLGFNKQLVRKLQSVMNCNDMFLQSTLHGWDVLTEPIRDLKSEEPYETLKQPPWLIKDLQVSEDRKKNVPIPGTENGKTQSKLPSGDMVWAKSPDFLDSKSADDPEKPASADRAFWLEVLSNPRQKLRKDDIDCKNWIKARKSGNRLNLDIKGYIEKKGVTLASRNQNPKDQYNPKAIRRTPTAAELLDDPELWRATLSRVLFPEKVEIPIGVHNMSGVHDKNGVHDKSGVHDTRPKANYPIRRRGEAAAPSDKIKTEGDKKKSRFSDLIVLTEIEFDQICTGQNFVPIAKSVYDPRYSNHQDFPRLKKQIIDTSTTPEEAEKLIANFVENGAWVYMQNIELLQYIMNRYINKEEDLYDWDSSNRIDSFTMPELMEKQERQDFSNKQRASNYLRPFFRHLMDLDLRNFRLYALTDIMWPSNPARYLHTHIHPILPTEMMNRHPHVYEGSVPTDIPRTKFYLEFLEGSEFKLIAGNEHVVWNNGELLAALLGRDTMEAITAMSMRDKNGRVVISDEMIIRAQKMLRKSTDGAYYDYDKKPKMLSEIKNQYTKEELHHRNQRVKRKITVEKEKRAKEEKEGSFSEQGGSSAEDSESTPAQDSDGRQQKPFLEPEEGKGAGSTDTPRNGEEQQTQAGDEYENEERIDLELSQQEVGVHNDFLDWKQVDREYKSPTKGVVKNPRSVPQLISPEKPMIVLSGRYAISETELNTVWLYFTTTYRMWRNDPKTNKPIHQWAVGNTTLWKLEFTANRGSFCVVDIRNTDHGVGPEIDRTGGTMRYCGSAYQYHFRTVSVINEMLTQQAAVLGDQSETLRSREYGEL